MHTQLSEKAKRNVMMLADAVMLSMALWASVVLRYGDIRHDVGPFWVLFLVLAILFCHLAMLFCHCMMPVVCVHLW